MKRPSGDQTGGSFRGSSTRSLVSRRRRPAATSTSTRPSSSAYARRSPVGDQAVEKSTPRAIRWRRVQSERTTYNPSSVPSFASNENHLPSDEDRGSKTATASAGRAPHGTDAASTRDGTKALLVGGSRLSPLPSGRTP